jgi:hypothetical protein
MTVQFSPDIEAKLRERARQTGTSVEQFVSDAVKEALDRPAPAAPQTLSTEHWLEAFDRWVESHPIRPGVNLDDSRESIYAGRGE